MKYEIRKTIRFKLSCEDDNIKDDKLKPPSINHTQNSQSKNTELIESLKYVFENVNLLFFKDKDISFRNVLKIKYQFLKSHPSTKNSFYNWIKNKKHGENKKYHELSKIEFLPEIFEKWVNEWKEIYEGLQELNDQPLENQKRRREFAFWLRTLEKRSNLNFIKEFVSHIHNANQTTIESKDEQGKKHTLNIDKTIKNLKTKLEEIREELKKAIRFFLPSQTEGVELAKASFNYYTLNKTTRFYSGEIAKNKKEVEENNLPCFLYERKNKTEVKFKIDESFFKSIALSENRTDWTLDTAYKKLKEWKAAKKSAFIEEIQKIKNIEDLTDEKFKAIQKDHPLFESSFEKLKNFVEKTIEIEKDRGSFFNFKQGSEKVKDSEVITKRYYELCELYKRIAQKRGQVLARIKGLEYEKIDAELLTHWAFILKKDDQHHLIVVPKEGDNLTKCKKLIDDNKKNEENNNQQNNLILYTFESLTLRALEKLCFKENENTFKEAILNEIKECKKNDNFYYPRYKRELYNAKKCNSCQKPEKTCEKCREKTELEGDKKLIQFYQKVLATDYAKKEVSKYDGINDITEKKYEDVKEPLDEFRKDLEQCCYVKRKIIQPEFIETLKNKYKASILSIDNLDLRLQREDTDGKINNKKYKDTNLVRKEHDENTQKKPTLLWKEFWTPENEKNYKTRINPEIKILWREARDSRVKKYGKSNKGYKNRFLQPQYTLLTTITENAGEKDLNFQWNTEKELKGKIKKFNQNNSQNKDEYFYGIDRGLKELATLCIVKFDDGFKDPEVVKEPAKQDTYKVAGVDFPDDICLYTLKKYKYYYQENQEKKDNKDRNIDKEELGKDDKRFGGPIKNISNVIDKYDDKNWFDKSTGIQNAAIDLTTAKVIKGKIVTNGDLQTLLNLKKIAAKRKLYDLFHQGKGNIELEIKKIKDKKDKYYLIVKNLFSFKEKDKPEHCIKFYEFTELDHRYDKRKERIFDFSKKLNNDVFKDLKEEQKEGLEKCKERIKKINEQLDSENIFIEKGKKGLFLKKGDKYLSCEDYTLYWFTEEQNDFEKERETIIDNLQIYINELYNKNKTHNEPSIEKINHLRDAITANMVGVIDFLHKKYPVKRIVLENLDEYKGETKYIDSHFDQSNENISRRLEWSLYRKFQNYGLVPSNIKKTILLKDEYKETQFGVIKFVKTGGTSSNCPVCGKKKGKEKCTNCKHDVTENTRGLVPLDNWDKVAAYNVAKSGLKNNTDGKDVENNNKSNA